MPLLIDGFNLIYKFPDLEGLMYEGKLFEAREGLLVRLKAYQKLKKTHIRVVFDGKKEPSRNLKSERSGSIDVYYSIDYSADFLIKEFLKKDPNPKMTTVITSDKDIIAFITRLRAKSVTSEKFAEYLNRTLEDAAADKTPEKEDDPVVTEDEISFWERMFGSRKK